MKVYKFKIVNAMTNLGLKSSIDGMFLIHLQKKWSMKTVQRILHSRILNRIRPNKVVLLFGARRVGKTVLIKEILKEISGSHILLNGEDFNTQQMLEMQTAVHYRQLFAKTDVLVIDEAQSIKDIGKKLKLIVDEVEGISVIASGSSSFDLLNKTGEPLVGRSSQFFLFPFSQDELSNYEHGVETLNNLETRMIFGSYPEVVGMQSNDERKEYLIEIANAYLLKDILSIDGIKNASKMKDLLRLVAFQMGNEVSYEEIGKQLGMSKNTVERYLDLLSKVFIIYRLGAFSTNQRNEVIKAGKWYFYDNGIRNALISNFQPLHMRSDVGSLWESYLIGEKMKLNYHHGLQKEYYFWRNYHGSEIDLIEISPDKIKAYELKWGNKNVKIPPTFNAFYPETDFGLVNRSNYLHFISADLNIH